jgi:hypothetical protein
MVVFFLLIFTLLFNAFLKHPSENIYFKTEENEKFYNFGGPVEKDLTTITDYPQDKKNRESLSNPTYKIQEIGSLEANQSHLVSDLYINKNTIKYKVKKGDTLEKIAQQFNISTSTILANNNIKKLNIGSWIVIKKFEDEKFSKENQFENLPLLKNYFSLPAKGWNWGKLHEYNAIDIANQCGTPVYASAEGVVINDPSLEKEEYPWNKGYGLFILIEHQNGTKTRYAHLSKSLVKIGDFVKKGQKIGLMGNTGESHGPTGCHLHFEVYGAQNPFALE